MFEKTVLKVPKTFQKNIFSRFPFLVIRTVQCTTYNYTENGIHYKGCLWVIPELSKLFGSTYDGLVFNKLTEEFLNFRTLSIIALLEIPGNSLLTGAASFSNVFSKFWKKSRKSSVKESLYSKLQAFKLQPPALPCMFLNFWKISEIQKQALTCSLQNSCSKEVFGKVPGSPASLL